MPRGDEITRRFNPISATYHAVIATGSMTALVVGIAGMSRPLRER